MGFTEDSAAIIKEYPKKFLWPDLLKFFEGKTDADKYESI
jgi:hypothetical protein